MIGHLVMAVIDRSPTGSLRGTNLLTLYPSWEWLGLIAPMPMFFVAAGWASVTSSATRRVHRLTVLIGTSAVVVVAWSLVSIGEILVTHRSGVIGDGARIATQPLWFLAAYVPFAASSQITARLVSRISPFILLCIAVVAASDVSRFIFDAPRWVGYPGFFATWIIPWSLGVWWRTTHDSGVRNEKTIGITMVAVGILASALLVSFFGYIPSLIDAVPGQRSNTTPPTLFTCAVSLTQVGLLMVCAQRFDGIASRSRHMMNKFNVASLGIYVWHLSAVVLCAALIALGMPMPIRFSVGWWIMRVPWFAAIAILASLFVLATTWVHTHKTNDVPEQPTTHFALASSVALVTTGATLTGVYGPRTLPLAFAMMGSFVGGWLVLSVHTSSRSNQYTE